MWRQCNIVPHHVIESIRFLSNSLGLSCCCLWLLQAIVCLFKYNRITFVRKGLHAQVKLQRRNPRVRFTSPWCFGYTKIRHSIDTIVNVKLQSSYENFYVLSIFRACKGWLRATAVIICAVIISVLWACADGMHREGFVSVLTCQSRVANRIESNRKALLGQVKDFKSSETQSCFQIFG